MKKLLIMPILIFFLLVVVITINPNNNNQLISEVNLKEFTVDNINIGSNVENISLSNYKMIPWERDSYDYSFDNISIKYDDNGFITKIHGNIEAIDMPYEFNNIKDVINHFNVDYEELDYDRDQGIKVIKYKDSKHNLGIEFMYSAYDGKLIWVKLYKLNV